MLDPINFGPWTLPGIPDEDEVGPILGGEASTPADVENLPHWSSRSGRKQIPPRPVPGTSSKPGNEPFRIELSVETSWRVFAARVQFVVNYAVVKAVNDAFGVETPQTTLALRDCLSFLTQIEEPPPGLGNPQPGKPRVCPYPRPLDGRREGSPLAFLNFLQVVLSPANTAARLVNHARTMCDQAFGKPGPSGQAGRRWDCLGFLKPVMGNGFLRAHYMVGRMPDVVAAGLDLTESLVLVGLETLVTSPVTRGPTDFDLVLAGITAHQAELDLMNRSPGGDAGFFLYTDQGTLTHVIKAVTPPLRDQR